MSGILYVVATPIGNLEDVTLRALRILRDVSLIAAEDTRRTGRLLQHYSISTPTTSLHEHNERQKTPSLIARLQKGESIALVSDAGTPLISDPGQSLVSAARDAGIRVESVPGPSAVMAAMASAGFAGDGFTFAGFPPSRSKDRKTWLQRLSEDPRLVVFFEAPHRIQATLDDLQGILGPEQVVGIARELTKAHEELVIRPISELRAYFHEPRGEFTVLIPVRKPRREHAEKPSKEQLAHEIGELTNSLRTSRREALRLVGAKYGIRPNEMYAMMADQHDKETRRSH
ncbi:MAG TPA: 16S rRNA (cytidine(1402)-2'-O)-methyltransferase [Sphingomicrobium sp.]